MSSLLAPNKVQVFNYKILKEVPIGHLSRFRKHWRLRVFCLRGTQCVSCGKVGSRLIKGADGSGNSHWDVYTEDLYPLTVDHIIPKSLGGPDTADNLQPMCSGCNTRKGNGRTKSKLTRSEAKDKTDGYERIPNLKGHSFGENFAGLVGKEVWRRRGKAGLLHPLGLVNKVVPNPHTGEMSATIVGKDKSFYHLISLFVPVD